MVDAFICDFVRIPIGRYEGSLALRRADDLAAHAIGALAAKYPSLRERVDEVFMGCANQAGEDNRNVARMALLLAGLPDHVPGVTLNIAVEKLLKRLGLRIADLDVIELNEAFASQALACTRSFGLADDAEQVNANGGAIALGHPLGMSGARIVGAAVQELTRRAGKYALATMCVGVGQGAALVVQRV